VSPVVKTHPSQLAKEASRAAVLPLNWLTATAVIDVTPASEACVRFGAARTQRYFAPHQRLGLFLVRHARRTSFSLLRPCLIQSFITSSSPGCRPLTPCPLGLACVLPKVQIACYRKEQNSNKVTKSTRQQTQVLFWKHLFAITHAPLSITSFLSFHSNALSISHQPPALGAGFTH